MGLFSIGREMVGMLRAQVKTLEEERDFWRSKYLRVIEMQGKQKVQEAPPSQKQGESNPIEELALSLARGGGLAPPSKLTAWRAARTADHRKERLALETGPLGRVNG